MVIRSGCGAGRQGNSVTVSYHVFPKLASTPAVPGLLGDPSKHRQAAIYMERGAGCIGCFLACEIPHGGADLSGNAEPASRNVARDTLVLLLRQHGGHG